VNLKEIINSFRAKDNVAFRYIYITYSEYCMKGLKKYRNCSHEEAQDFFIDAVMIFKDKAESGSVTYLSNLQSFLYKICENNWHKIKV